jgi:hypothetical protein
VGIDFESEVDRLYGLEPDKFVEERTALARALRNEDRRAEATRVQELRKPTLAAWTVNQLARRNRKDVDLLLDAGHRLAAAQSEVLAGGDRSQFAEAREHERTALRRLEDAAREVLGERAGEATLRQVSATLRAAAVSEQGRELLARGRLTGELEPTGFEALAAVAPPVRTRGTPKAKPKSKPTTVERSARPVREDRTRAEEAERRQAEARAKAEQAAARRDAIAQARETLNAARERERELAAKARAAERAVTDARKTLARAEREVEALEAERQAAAEAVEGATRALDEARAGD